MENEQQVLEKMSPEKANLYFVPLVWATSLVNRARKEGRIKDDFAVKTLIDVRAIIFNAPCYAGAVYAVILCPSCLFVHLSVCH